jgi:hypothetical protein
VIPTDHSFPARAVISFSFHTFYLQDLGILCCRANAIFSAPCNVATRWGPEEHVHRFDLPYPVLSFDVEALDPMPGSSSHRNRIWITLDQTFEEDGTRDINDLERPLNRDTTGSTTEVGETKIASSHSIYVLEWQGSGKVDLRLLFRHVPVLYELFFHFTEYVHR